MIEFDVQFRAGLDVSRDGDGDGRAGSAHGAEIVDLSFMFVLIGTMVVAVVLMMRLGVVIVAIILAVHLGTAAVVMAIASAAREEEGECGNAPAEGQTGVMHGNQILWMSGNGEPRRVW